MNDLQERFVHFASLVFQTAAPLMKNSLIEPAIKHLVIASCSAGAIYPEVESDSSGRNFQNKVRLALIELKEAQYWLHFLLDSNRDLSQLTPLVLETEELIKILSGISKKTNPGRKPIKQPILLPFLF